MSDVSVSLTTFVDFVSKAGTPKYTVVKQWKHQPPYNPAMDFYKPIREEIISIHQNNLATSNLSKILSRISDQKKKDVYPEIIEGYKKWIGRKKAIWFEPPHGKWNHLNLNVSVNPELGLKIGDSYHIIKLYFKAEPLTKNRIEIITHMMGEVFPKHLSEGYKMTVLHVRNAKPFTPKVPIAGLSIQLEAEVAYWLNLWDKL
jgi:hypothetical protein